MAREVVPAGTRVLGKWPRQGVTFDVRRGSFVIPAHLLDDEHEVSRIYATSIPEGAETTGRRDKVYDLVPDGDAFAPPRKQLRGIRVHWRAIRVVAA